ncbi:MAG: hypothetical protein AUJ28_03615 [Parcubacteria group bacterium CG1_02_37_51]|nr:MAG: hypothetical protein AUJ28_03615 [Parcubacteria group bacterium CG1_02_37_51]
MTKKAKTNKKDPQQVKYEIDLADFDIADEYIVQEVVDQEKRKILSEYNLDRIISQESSAANFIHKKSSLIPVSPHLVNLKNKFLEEQKRKTEIAEAELAQKKFVNSIGQAKDSIKKINTQWHSSTQSGIRKIANLSTYFQTEIRFHSFVLAKLSIMQLLFSSLKIIDNLINSIYNFLLESRDLITRLKSKCTVSDLNYLQHSRLVFAKFIIFIFIAALLLTPFGFLNVYQQAVQDKGRVLGISYEAAKHWQAGAEYISQGQWQLAAKSFDQAGINFQKAKAELENYNQLILKAAKYIPGQGSDLHSGENLIKLGDKLSSLIAEISSVIANKQDLGDLTLIEQLDLLAEQINYINTKYAEITPLLSEIDYQVLPDAYQVLFLTWQDNNKFFISLLNDLNSTLNWLQQVLAAEQPQRYLLVFQNSNELRATGGFMGSFALVDIDQGAIVNIEMPGGGFYDLEGQLKEFVIAPYPQQLLGSRWQIWDANWWPDWPTSAAKIAWFYEKTGGPTVDGVFAINSQVMVDLMELFGPIDLPQYDKVLTHQNVIEALQHAVEFEYDIDVNKPKQILADLLPILIDNIYALDTSQLLMFGNMINSELRYQDMQLYFTDPVLQDFAIQKDWAGSIQDTTGDYLKVVAQNIGGGKTDEVIEQNVAYSLTIGPDQYLIAKTLVTRKHNGDLNDVFTRHRNVSFIRLYVPEGSDLISIEGAIEPDQKLFKEIYDNLEADIDLIKYDGLNYYLRFDQYYETEQFNKQVFGQWLMLDPGEEKTLEFIYRLPIKITTEESTKFLKWFQGDLNELVYSLYYEQQAGLKNGKFSMKFELPSTMTLKWFNDTNQKMYKLGNWLYTEDDSREDYVLGFILQ